MKQLNYKNSAKTKLLFTCYFLLASFCSFAQDSIVIQGELKNNSKFAKVVIKKFGVGSFDIAAVPIKDGKFRIPASMNLETGVYRFQYNQTSSYEYVDIIISGKEKVISFSLDVLEEIENRKPTFSQSEENKKWYNYKANEELQLQKINALQNALAFYPNGKDKIVYQLQKAIDLEQKNQKKNFHQFTNENKESWAVAMVANKPAYFTNAKDDWRLQDFERRKHYWDGIDTANPQLIRTPLYTDLILEYLKYYMNPEMHFGEDEMNEGFKKSVDTIMTKFSGSEETKKFALQYLQLGFKEIGNEKVLQYIDEKYQELANQCQDEADKAAFEKRMAGYAAMKEGTIAPNIVFENKNTLYDIQSEQTLVVFWASWCPHCMEEMPKVNAWAKENPNTKVVAISLDDITTEFEKAIKGLPNLLHHTDLKKWNGAAVTDYFVYGTPTFILIDKDKKIIGKYASFENISIK